MKKENIAIIEMLLCATLWSIAGIFMKKLPWNGFALASLRSIIAALTIGTYMALKKVEIVVSSKTILSGILAGCVYLCFTIANKLTTAANAIVLQFTSPVFIIVFSSLLFKTKINKRDLFTVLITMIGITLCFLDDVKGGYILGNIVSILAGVFMAGMFISIGHLENNLRFSAALFGQLFTAIIGFPFVLISHPIINITTISYIMILGIFQLGISYILYVHASEYCHPLACCLLGVLEPLLNPIWVMLFDGEVPGTYALIGGLVVVITITIWCACDKKEESSES